MRRLGIVYCANSKATGATYAGSTYTPLTEHPALHITHVWICHDEEHIPEWTRVLLDGGIVNESTSVWKVLETSRTTTTDDVHQIEGRWVELRTVFPDLSHDETTRAIMSAFEEASQCEIERSWIPACVRCGDICTESDETVYYFPLGEQNDCVPDWFIDDDQILMTFEVCVRCVGEMNDDDSIIIFPLLGEDMRCVKL